MLGNRIVLLTAGLGALVSAGILGPIFLNLRGPATGAIELTRKGWDGLFYHICGFPPKMPT